MESDENKAEINGKPELVIETDTKFCPLCAERIKSAAIKCRFCGEDLLAYETKQKDAVEKIIYSEHPPLIYSLVQYLWIILTLGLILIYYFIKSRQVKFIISTQRVKVETGIFMKQTEIIELFRVDDFEIVSPIAQRILGYGILRIKSSDRIRPNLDIYGLPDPERIYNSLRDCVMREREKRGIKVWVNA